MGSSGEPCLKLRKNINKRRPMWLSEGGGKLETGKSESQ